MVDPMHGKEKSLALLESDLNRTKVLWGIISCRRIASKYHVSGMGSGRFTQDTCFESCREVHRGWEIETRGSISCVSLLICRRSTYGKVSEAC
jgi:hypothetical protein